VGLLGPTPHNINIRNDDMSIKRSVRTTSSMTPGIKSTNSITPGRPSIGNIVKMNPSGPSTSKEKAIRKNKYPK
jgi:hypothetical protein